LLHVVVLFLMVNIFNQFAMKTLTKQCTVISDDNVKTSYTLRT